MKTILSFFALITVLIFTAEKTQAQAWERHATVLSIGFGLSDFFHVDDYYYRNGNRNHGYYNPRTGQFNLQMEFGIHNYVGLGFTTGVGLRRGWNNDYQGEVNIPFGILCNFHFYQLIDDKASKDIHADKLDIYAGISAGGGIAITTYNNDYRRNVPIAFGGPHVGIRWYFTERTALNAEVGYGKSLVNIGFAFKL